MNIHECERLAQKMPMGQASFTANFPAGERKCVWLDQYMGLITVEGMKGFCTKWQFEELFPRLECTEPVEISKAEAEELIQT